MTPEGETVWKFANPFKPAGGAPPNPNGAPKRPDAAAAAKGNAQDKSKDQRDPAAATSPHSADTKKDRSPAGPAHGTPRKQGNTLFRATRYALEHPAFAGKTLKPGKTVVEIRAGN